MNVIDATTRSRPRLLWTGRGENPYPSFIAHADVLIVTADSVNMTSEACATGRPVYVFEAANISNKHARFHEALRRHGATRSLPEGLSRLEQWTYTPLDAATEIAAEITRRWVRPGSSELNPPCS
jgi:mitochondrial fission protein ELM1